MITVYSADQESHDVRLEVTTGEARPPYEMPERGRRFKDAIIGSGVSQLIEPRMFGLEPVTAVHDSKYIAFLEEAWDLWVAECGDTQDAIPYCFPHRGLWQVEPRNIEGRLGYYSFDLSAAIGAGTWKGIRAAANVALEAADQVVNGATAVCGLCRPPGHHAGIDLMGGYCYINNAAVAAQYLLDHGLGKVAILDVDYHHGNGTQSIFYSRDDVFFASLHGDPEDEYPHFSGYAAETGAGPGLGYNLNLPLPVDTTDWQSYKPALTNALEKIDAFSAEALVVSLGLDAHEADPISRFLLTTDDFYSLGELIENADLPTVFITEGGYAMDAIGPAVANVLQAFDRNRRQ